MDWRELDTHDRTTLVNGLANDVHDTTESTLSDGDLNWGTSINNLLATNETFCTIHSNGSDRVLAEMGGNLKDKTTTLEVLNLESIQNWWQVVGVELNVNDGTNDSFHLACCGRGFGGI
jgi:hypothetical protein